MVLCEPTQRNSKIKIKSTVIFKHYIFFCLGARCCPFQLQTIQIILSEQIRDHKLSSSAANKRKNKINPKMGFEKRIWARLTTTASLASST